MFSNTARIVEKAAKLRNRKNSDPQSLPRGMAAKMLGSVTKIRPGPAVVSTL